MPKIKPRWTINWNQGVIVTQVSKSTFIEHLQAKRVVLVGPRQASVAPGWTAWIDYPSNALRFVESQVVVDRFSPPSQFARLLELLKYSPPYNEWLVRIRDQVCSK